MDWSIFVYFLAAVVAAGVSYAVWPKDHRPKLKISDASFIRSRVPHAETDSSWRMRSVATWRWLKKSVYRRRS